MAIEFIREQCCSDPVYELTRGYIVQMYNVTNGFLNRHPTVHFTVDERLGGLHTVDDLHVKGA